jgi:hypothetical protein
MKSRLLFKLQKIIKYVVSKVFKLSVKIFLGNHNTFEGMFF